MAFSFDHRRNGHSSHIYDVEIMLDWMFWVVSAEDMHTIKHFSGLKNWRFQKGKEREHKQASATNAFLISCRNGINVLNLFLLLRQGFWICFTSPLRNSHNFKAALLSCC